MKITRHVGKHRVYLILRDEMRCLWEKYVCIACQISKNLNLFPFTCILRRINYYHTSVRKYNMNACMQCHNIETWKIGCKNNKLPLRFFFDNLSKSVMTFITRKIIYGMVQGSGVWVKFWKFEETGVFWYTFIGVLVIDCGVDDMWVTDYII